ncbi:hypothetical protein Val02_16220 [Virgisporangium aliadipatigenens]|uniref:DUF1707 domain-containing protein n=1 Tax=Virgisporangium aliadipatigenens TaxID=741659 RepID=A0A8J3YIW1_9ACTN|nr:DUF1707 domain-containing protein [Virgisporangium aliadipatigenens]GIJ44736.1 hypothetical protein Val02_16220 [Virgisporangium aliadipatigenens]
MQVRASDADRERTMDALREHTAAGRLTLDEFADRAAVVVEARTLDELRATVADLPRHEPTPDTRPLVVAFCVALAVVILFAVLYSLAR